MSTDIPATVSAETVTSWSDDVDVTVIGFGIAGGCAAVSAAAAGARVLVLERAAAAGGTTALAGGHFYLGGGTTVQLATGHPDSPEEMYKYLVAVSREPDHDKIRAYCDGSVEHFNWLEGLGFQFERSYFPGKAVIQPNTEGLMFTGNEKVWPFLELAVPAPRGHKVPVPGDTGGAAMVIDLLLKRAASLGIQIRYETGATELIVDGTGKVTGVMWKRFSETGAIKAKSVIIAAGGFVMNPDMVAKYTPKLAEKPFVLGNTYDDGLGIRLGVSAGGATQHMDQMFITAPPYPPSILLTGIIVNKLGQRFVAEDSYHSRTAGFIMEQPDSAAYLIVDEAHLEHPKMAASPVDRRLGNGCGNGSRAWHSTGQPGGDAGPLQRLRRARRRSRFPQAAGIPCSTRQRAVGGVRHVAGQGDVCRIHSGRAGHVGGRSSTARRRRGGGRPVRGRGMRVQYRPGRQGICQRDPAG